MENWPLDPFLPIPLAFPCTPAIPIVWGRHVHVPPPWYLALRANGEGLATGLLGSIPDLLQHQQCHCCSLKVLFFFRLLFHFLLSLVHFQWKLWNPSPYSLIHHRWLTFYFSNKACSYRLPQPHSLPSHDFPVFICSSFLGKILRFLFVSLVFPPV